MVCLLGRFLSCLVAEGSWGHFKVSMSTVFGDAVSSVLGCRWYLWFSRRCLWKGRLEVA